MTRPDPRLLVPCDVLPFVPEGARVWSDDPFFPDPFVMDGRLVVRVDLAIDLSTPALRDGVPERLDALPWALGVLGWRLVQVYADGTYDNGATWHPIGPDLSNLTHADAARAVVAAALRQRVRP